MQIVTILGRFGYKLDLKFQYQISFIFKNVFDLSTEVPHNYCS